VRLTLGCVLFLACASRAAAQDYDGHLSALFVAMPDVGAAQGRQSAAELRVRLFAETRLDPTDRIHVRAGLFVDALAARREQAGPESAAGAALVRPADLFIEFRGDRLELRAGMARTVWGRLDEFQPTDVVNPIDLSRFLLEGRSEARLPVSMVRARVFLPAGTVLESLVVPLFRASRFDQLDEQTSPFRVAPAGELERLEPGVSWRNVQGGLRLTSTAGRVDWGLSAWRGFESFPRYAPASAVPDPLALERPRLLEVFPRFTMVGADFETVRGAWGVRGELAWFDGAAPRSFEAGIGADRRAGNYRVALNAVVSRAGATDVTMVGWAERTFAHETRRMQLLAVYDPADATVFGRAIAAFNLRDNVWLEGSAGLFGGTPAEGGTTSAIDLLGLLSRRDFLYARVKVHF